MCLSTSIEMREVEERSKNGSDKTDTDESTWNVGILTVWHRPSHLCWTDCDWPQLKHEESSEKAAMRPVKFPLPLKRQVSVSGRKGHSAMPETWQISGERGSPSFTQTLLCLLTVLTYVKHLDLREQLKWEQGSSAGITCDSNSFKIKK